MAGKMKDFFDATVAHHGKLSGKVGAAFSSSMNVGGGNETTVLDILHVMLIHGMIIQGTDEGDHYGPVAVDAPDERVKPQCEALGKRIASLTARLFG
jgi:NAD(P)H dehydrogenase (quinone)